jgi:hypothetical protein
MNIKDRIDYLLKKYGETQTKQTFIDEYQNNYAIA